MCEYEPCEHGIFIGCEILTELGSSYFHRILSRGSSFKGSVDCSKNVCGFRLASKYDLVCCG
ncbi:MAG: hypothetical protein ACK55Z_36480, partial [bacterium]